MASESVPLAIVGIGCLFPKANGPGAFWANIKHGVDCVGPVPPTHWSPEDYFDADPKAPDRTYAARGAFLDPVEFNPLEFGISPVDLEATDTSQLLGLVAARQALNDAGYTPDRKFDRNRISVILGVTGTLELVIPLGARLGHPKWRKALAAAGVDAETTERVVQDISDSYVPWQENSFPGLLGNVVAGRIANKLDLGGTNCVVDAACASSLSAIHLAGLELQSGRCDVAVTGGVDTFNDIFMYMCFSKTPALSRTGDAKPFDADGDGTILGEGLGIVVLKRLADAERDGDRVYSVLKAIGSSSDGKGNAVYAPSASGQVRALQNAFELAGVSPATIELIEAHGTGTKVGDSVEATALAEVFRQAKPDGTWCAVGSVKSMIGHTKAAAGAAGLIKAALALYNKVLPPTIKVRQAVEPLRPGKSPLYLNTEKRPWLPRPGHPRRAGMSAFGFGGSNFHAVLEEHRPTKPGPDWDGRVQIVALSAETPERLASQFAGVPSDGNSATVATWAAATRESFDRTAVCRLVLVAHRDEGFGRSVAAATARLRADPSARAWALAEGAYFGQGPADGPVGVLFPGQGSQRVGMLRDLACTFPEMLECLSTAEAGWTGSKRLVDFIYPIPAFTADARAEQEAELRATEIAQPALGAVSLGAWRVLERFGVTAGAFAGHSYGELVALSAAGAFDPAALHRLSRERGRLMASFRGEDAGSMLAVHAAVADVESALRDEGLDLIIANRNSPDQCVLSGATAEIARAEVALRRRKVRSTRLPVAAAFHSPLVERASDPFRRVLEEVPFRPKQVPVFGNTDARKYPDGPHDARDRLAEQLARPVEFVRQIENMALAGVRTFVEVGPGSVLTPLAEATLKARPELSDWDCFALDASGGKKPCLLDLGHALARLAARGHAVNLTRWEAGQTYPAPTAKPGLTIPLVGANYVRPRPAQAAPSVNGKATVNGKPAAPSPSPAEPSPPPAEPVDRVPLRKSMSESPPNPPADPSGLSGALAVTQQSLLAFQRMQEQTASLHKQFLENQQAALATLQALIAQQQALITGQPVSAIPLPAPAGPVVAPPAPIATPQAVLPPPPPPAPVVQAAPVKPAPAAVPKSAPPVRDASTILLAVVAEKTGYPADMLGLDMALDADLGIDSIKRVEILSALQERVPDAPEVRPEHLGTLHTLRDIVNFLGGPAAPVADVRSESVPPPSAATSPQPARGASGPQLDLPAILLAVVAEKTGYPADMLGLDMALDADLGIDSIKRVEILSALQEKVPDAPEVKPEHLGTLHTLRDIASFLGSNGASPAVVTPAVVDPRPFASALTPGSAEGGRASDPTADRSEAVPAVAEQGRVVRKVIRPVPLDERDRRSPVRFDDAAPVWLVCDPSDFAAGLTRQLEAAGGRVRGFRWNETPPSEKPASLGGLVLVAPDDSVPADFPLRAFRWLRNAGPGLTASARTGGAFLATVSKLDGAFGFGPFEPARDPVQGALAGLTKTAAHEWPAVACKAIDVDPNVLADLPRAVVEEVLTAGPAEVGLSAGGRVALEAVPSPVEPAGSRPSTLRPGDVVVVTGGARGVTAEALVPLARDSRPKLVLLGRTPEPGAEPAWLERLEGEARIKQAIVANTPRVMTPREVGAEYKRVLAQREVRTNLRRLREAGAAVEYLAVDVQDAAAVSAALRGVRARLGPVAGLVHGAGVLADRRIEDLTDEQFQHVYSTKVAGLRNLVAATGRDPLKAIVLFSSSTGRFGRTGQVAYAAANEVLNKTAQRLTRTRPDCRTVAVNWGPWDGGMVTPALAKVFAGEGIGLIPLAEGGQVLLRELSADDGAAEVVVLAPPAPPVAPAVDVAGDVFERSVRLSDHGVLRSHVIGDKAVLPFVLHVEWLVHAAMHGNPGLKFHGFDNLRIFHGVHVEEATTTTVRVLSGKAARRDGLFFVPVELRGTRKGKEVTHSRAQIVLADRLPEAPPAHAPPNIGPSRFSVDEVYDEVLFHGLDLRAFDRLEGMDDAGAIAFARTAPPPASWMDNPVRGAWLADPLASDAVFQLLSIWSYQKHGAVSLPCFVGRYRQYRRAFPPDGVAIAVRITTDTGSTARADVELLDPDGGVVATLADAEHVIDPSLNDAFRRGRAAGARPVSQNGGGLR